MLFAVMTLAAVVWLAVAVHFGRAWRRHRHPVALAVCGHAFTMGIFGLLMWRARGELVGQVLPFAGGLSLLASLLILVAIVTSKLRRENDSCGACGSRSWLY